MSAAAALACADRSVEPSVTPPASVGAEVTRAPTQPCQLEGLALGVPVAEGWALGTTPQGCLLIDERRTTAFVMLATLPPNVEGADLLARDFHAFIRDTELLGTDVQFAGSDPLMLLGERTAADRFTSELVGIGPIAGWALHRMVGPVELVVLLVHESPLRGPSDVGADLRRAVEDLRRAAPQPPP